MQNEITNPGSQLMNDEVEFGEKDIIKNAQKSNTEALLFAEALYMFFYRHHYKNIIDISEEINHQLNVKNRTKDNKLLQMIMPLLGIRDPLIWDLYAQRLVSGYELEGNYFKYQVYYFIKREF